MEIKPSKKSQIMIPQFNFLAYFELMATNLVSIQHGSNNKHGFLRASGIQQMEELVYAKGKVGSTCLVIFDNDEGNLIVPADNAVDNTFYTVAICRPAKNQNFDDITTVKASLKVTYSQIMAKMLRDKMRGKHALKFFDSNSVSFYEYGPFNGTWFARIFTFTCQQPGQIIYTPSDFLDDF